MPSTFRRVTSGLSSDSEDERVGTALRAKSHWQPRHSRSSVGEAAYSPDGRMVTGKSTCSADFNEKYRNHRLTYRKLSSVIGLTQMKKRHRSRSSEWAINPDDNEWLQRWDKLMVLALVHVALIVPVQISMLDFQFDALFYLTCVMDCIFIIDMGLQFFVMYPEVTTSGVVLEHRIRRIAYRYLQTWFAIDCLSVIPFELIAVLLGLSNSEHFQTIKIIRLIRLIKLTRVVRAQRLIDRFEIRMKITYKELSLLRFFVILVVLTHWLANLWALTLVLVSEDEGLPRWIDDITLLEVDVKEKTKDTTWKLYITCLYFTTYTLTSVGYGDIAPKNILERTMCTLLLFISGTSWALILGQVSGIVATMKPDEQAFRKLMDELQLMMRDQNMSEAMRRRLRTFFLANKKAQRRARHHKVLESLSHGLKGEVALVMNWKWITKVSFLRTFIESAEHSRSRAFVIDLSQVLVQSVHAQSELFGKPQVLYILTRGLVSRHARLHLTGHVWGLDFVLADRALVERTDCYALTYSEVSSLQRNVFMNLIVEHERACPDLQRQVRRFCIWLAFQRALMVEARRRHRHQKRIQSASV